MSGSKTKEALRLITGSDEKFKPRFAHLRKLRNPTDLEIIDSGLVLFFPGPNSFTGEDVAEFQVGLKIYLELDPLKRDKN